MDNKQKCLCMIAILIAFLSFAYATSISATNQTLGLNIVVNNTNLAPTIEPSAPGTGERINGVTYYNNNSDIEIFLYAHANATSQTSDIRLYINGTQVSSVSSKPVGAAPEENNKSIVAIIPRYASYKAVFANYHHYEWREYKILSGNFTSNITSSSCSGCVNQTQLDGKVNITTNSITNIIATDGTNFTQITLQPQVMSIEASDGGTSQIQITQDVINFAFNMTNSLLMNEGSTTSYKNLDMSNKNIINCANCVSVSSDLINETNISSASNWVNISIPSQYQNRFGYDIQIYINDTTGSTIIYKMYVNNLINDSNYRSQFTQYNGASVVASRDSAANILTASTNSETFAKIYMGLSPGNNLVIQSETSRLIGSTGIIREQYYNTYITPISTIANISLFSPTASGIGAGSKISIFKSKLT